MSNLCVCIVIALNSYGQLHKRHLNLNDKIVILFVFYELNGAKLAFSLISFENAYI